LPLSIGLCLCTVFSAKAEEKKQPPADLVEQMLAARVGCDRADSLMRANLSLACDQFAKGCLTLGRFPESDQELSPLRSDLEKLVVANPYQSNSTLAQQMASQFPGAKAQLLILVDQFMNENSIRQMTAYPSTDLSGVPGSIKIIHNAYDTFVVIGIGIDGKPVLNNNGKPLIVERHPFLARSEP
jgi:hypothetical protein